MGVCSREQDKLRRAVRDDSLPSVGMKSRAYRPFRMLTDFIDARHDVEL